METVSIFDILTKEAPEHILQHFKLVLISLNIAILIAIPIGILLTRENFKKHSSKVIAILNTAQGVPSLAIVAIFLRILGIGIVPSIVALSLYGLLPIVQNTVVGINNINPEIIESARGVGMPDKKILYKIEIPLALPIIIAGIQTSSVLVVGTAAIADLIGAGGLGRLIFLGISHFLPNYTLVGASLCALMAILFDQFFRILNNKLTKKYKQI